MRFSRTRARTQRHPHTHAHTRTDTHTHRCAADAKAALAAKDAEVAKKDGLLADRARRIKELEEQVGLEGL